MVDRKLQRPRLATWETVSLNKARLVVRPASINGHTGRSLCTMCLNQKLVAY
jgi:hypothetical protein